MHAGDMCNERKSCARATCNAYCAMSRRSIRRILEAAQWSHSVLCSVKTIVMKVPGCRCLQETLGNCLTKLYARAKVSKHAIIKLRKPLKT